MQAIQKWTRNKQVFAVYFLSIILPIISMPLLGRLYVMVYEQDIPPHLFTIGFDNVVKAYLFGFIFFVALFSFLFVKPKWKLVGIGLIPVLLLMWFHTLWFKLVTTHFFGVAILIVFAWLLAKLILLIKKSLDQ